MIFSRPGLECRALTDFFPEINLNVSTLYFQFVFSFTYVETNTLGEHTNSYKSVFPGDFDRLTRKGHSSNNENTFLLFFGSACHFVLLGNSFSDDLKFQQKNSFEHRMLHNNLDSFHSL